jgi:predicted membrane channel-forming protein YqfA (hemolysin III family)
MFTLGIVLVIVALIVGTVQLTTHVFSIYENKTTMYGFYGAVGAMGLVGIIIALWSYMKKRPVTATTA